MKRELPHPAAGKVPMAASPLNLSGSPVEYRRAPPMLGEHTAQVLFEKLGLSADEIQALAQPGLTFPRRVAGIVSARRARRSWSPQAIHISNHPDRPYRGRRAFMKEIQTIGVVGAGAMGRGIAQIAAQAGLRVRLYDTSAEGCCAREALRQTWDKLAQKSSAPPTPRPRSSAWSRPARCPTWRTASWWSRPSSSAWTSSATCSRRWKAWWPRTASWLRTRPRCPSPPSLRPASARSACGYHFFNPVALMKVVEVIDGLRSAEVGDALAELARRMGPRRCAPRTCPASSSTMPVAA